MTNPPMGQPPFDPYQPPPFPPPYYPGGYPPMPVRVPDHPQAVTALVLGILGLVLCGGLTSPFAWWLGRKAMREIDASGGAMGGRGQAQAGFILGIIGTALLAVGVLIVVVAVLGALFSGQRIT